MCSKNALVCKSCFSTLARHKKQWSNELDKILQGNELAAGELAVNWQTTLARSIDPSYQYLRISVHIRIQASCALANFL